MTGRNLPECRERDCDPCPYPDCPDRVTPATGVRPFYVQIASRITGPPGEYLANVREVSACSRALMLAGFCPINPAADLLEGLMSAEEIPSELYHSRTMDLLRLLAFARRCGCRVALLVLHQMYRNGSPSTGVANEVALANELEIPVAYSLDGVLAMRGNEL